ncbi:MAG: sugar ABC transporter ATP-binding protein [Pyrinomonadaceae bacterium]
MPILSLTDIAKKFGPTIALDGVNFELNRGEVHGVIGENGAGKSTLMNILVGSLTSDRGEMQIDDRPYAPVSPHDARLHGIALIHQELSLCSHLTVAENILMGIEPSYPGRLGWIDRQAYRRKALEVLRSFNHPEITPEKRVGQLSLSACQVVEICRAIAANARIILMDEPTSSLQRDDVERLFGLIRRLKGGGIGVVYISHFLEEVREIADRYTVLRDGVSVDSGNISFVTNDHLISQMVGRSVDNLFPHRAHQQAQEVLLEVQNLVSLPGVKQASFALHRGEILGLAGLVGSGRTQTVRALFGLESCQSGTFRLANSARSVVQINRTNPNDLIRMGVGYLSEDRKGEGLALSQPISDNITLTRFSSCAKFGWLNLARQKKLSKEVIAMVGIKTKNPDLAVNTLSGGNQQKVAIARLLHQKAEVLLLDEPTRGVDIGSKAQIYQLIAETAEKGKAVLMVSSYLPELLGLCDRIAVMCRGRLLPAKPVLQWTPESLMDAACGTPNLH